jgi:beta-lactam-binding protein with PASTA domain
MRKLFRFLLLSLVLMLVCLSSALLAMRFAIHGREVRVPKLQGLTLQEAERVANDQGLVLSVEGRFYSVDTREGRIVSQMPATGTKVRRGWKISVAQSLGPQGAGVPNLMGQSQRAASINASRRGLEIGTAAVVHIPGVLPDTVVAQSPPADTKKVSSPRLGLVLAAHDNAQWYVMPRFIGRPLNEAVWELKQAGFTLGTISESGALAMENTADTLSNSGIILRQYPAPGQRIAAGSAINFEVAPK